MNGSYGNASANILNVDCVTEQIGVLLFAVQFKHQITELSNRMGAITKACYQILESERLPRCFELVLTIGNLLNAGTEMEDAHGVTLPSLLKVLWNQYLAALVDGCIADEMRGGEHSCRKRNRSIAA